MLGIKVIKSLDTLNFIANSTRTIQIPKAFTIGYLVDADFTTTLAAPGLGVADVVSVPSLEVLGLHPGQLGAPWFKRR